MVRASVTGLTTALDILTIVLSTLPLYPLSPLSPPQPLSSRKANPTQPTKTVTTIPILLAFQKQPTPLPNSNNNLTPEPSTSPILTPPKPPSSAITTALITTLALTTASFSAVRASKASTGTDLPQTAFWLALQASSALLAVGLGTFSRSLLGRRGVVEGGNLTGEGDIQAEEARGIQGRAGKVRLAGLWGLVKGVEGRDGQEVSQLGTVVVVGEEADGVPPLKEKVGAREEVRQTTSSPVPRNPPIAYHYPVSSCCRVGSCLQGF